MFDEEIGFGPTEINEFKQAQEPKPMNTITTITKGDIKASQNI
jgi:hypothetical protein